MEDTYKTREQLIDELAGLRQRIAELEAPETGRKQAEEALRESEEKYRQIVGNVYDMVYSLYPDGTLYFISPNVLSFTGYKPEEGIGHNIVEFIHPDDREHVLADFEKTIKTGEEFPTIFRFSRKDGSYFYAEELGRVIREGGKIVGVTGIIRDITERKKMEEALWESEEKYRALVEGLEDAIVRFALDGTILYCSPNVNNFGGYDSKEEIGQHFTKYIADEEAKQELQGFFQGIIERKKTITFEFLYMPKSKDPFYVEAKANPIINEKTDEIVSIQCIVRDITERKLMEEELRKYSEHLEEKVEERTTELNDTVKQLQGEITERKRAEDTLKESEEKFSKAFHASPDIFSISTLEDGIFIDVNESFSHISGYTHDEIIGHSSIELGIWVNKAERDKILRKIKKHGRVRDEEFDFRTKSGNIRLMLFSAELITIGSEQCIIAAVTDITERKQAEEALRESEDKYRKLFELGSDALFLIEVETGRILDLNDTALKMYGYSREEALQMKNTDFSAEPAQTRQATVEHEQQIPVRYHKKKDGTIFPTDISVAYFTWYGKEVCIAAIRDITERQQAEEALRESEERFRALVESTGDFIWEVDVNGVYTYCSPKIKELWGYTPEESIGKTPFERMIPEDRERFAEVFRTISESQSPFKGMESSSYDSDGHVVILETSGVPFYDADGRLLGYRGTSRDITERKQAKEQAREAETLRELDRLRTELLANISHELRTPLASIKGYATMLLDYDRRLKRDEKREYLETIDDNTDRLVELIEQLLDMSRLNAGILAIDKAPATINKLCREVIAEAQIRSPTHRIVPELPGRLLKVNVDARRIQQVLENLIGNAVKYSEAGTEVTVAARRVERELLVIVTD